MDLITRGKWRVLPAALFTASAALASASAIGGDGVWTASGSGVSGTVIVDPATGDAYAPGGFTALFKSADGGVSWHDVNLPLPDSPHISVGPLTTGPAGTVYATIGYGGNGFTAGQLYVSHDAGASWALLFQESPDGTYDALAVDPFASATLYRLDGFPLAGQGLVRSTDGGLTWTGVGLPQPDFSTPRRAITAFCLDPQTPGVIFAATVIATFPVATAGPVYKTSDGGNIWIPLGNSTPSSLVSLAVDPFSPTTLYARGTEVYKSEDGGATFRSISPNSPTSSTQILLDANRRNRIYFATLDHGVQTSADGGATWASMSSGLPTGPVTALALDPTRQLLYAATYTGIFEFQLGALTLGAAHPFSITLTATDQRTGRTGRGVETQVNDLWGYFSIPAITNNPNNPEVFVKLLDGTSVNGRYWFFYGGLTDLEYTLTVKDVATGLTKTYTKPAGSECGGSDTAAFAP